MIKSIGKGDDFMIFPENRKLFSIKEMCHACGVSRSTLIRLEEDGFLTPYHIDPNTGYRYYDLQNVTAVGQYQRLQEAGLSRKEIADLYFERVDSNEFLRSQRQRLYKLQRFLDEYELRHDHAQNYSFSYITLSAVTCYCEKISISSIEELSTRAFCIHEKCVAEGFRMLGSEPIFGLPDNSSLKAGSSDFGLNTTLCIPVVPDSGPDPHLRFFPATEAFSVFAHDDYHSMAKIFDLMQKEIDMRGIELSGPVRFIALVAPYAGAHYKHDDYCYECVIPVRERKD